MGLHDDLYNEFIALKDKNEGALLLRLAKRVPDDHPKAGEILNCCGFIGAVTGNGDYETLSESLSVLRRAVSVVEAQHDRADYAKVACNLLMVSTDLGLFHEVGDLSERLQEICQSDPKAAQHLPFTWVYAAMAHYYNARFSLASGLLSAAVRDNVTYDLRISVLISLAASYARQGKAESARTAWELSPKVPFYEPWSRSVNGLILVAEGKLDEAKQELLASLAIMGQPGTRYTKLHHAQVYWALAQLEEMSGSPGAAAYRDAAWSVVNPLDLSKVPLFAVPLPLK